MPDDHIRSTVPIDRRNVAEWACRFLDAFIATVRDMQQPEEQLGTFGIAEFMIGAALAGRAAQRFFQPGEVPQLISDAMADRIVAAVQKVQDERKANAAKGGGG